MWWHDIKEMKKKIDRIDSYIQECSPIDHLEDDFQEDIDRLQDKLNTLLNDGHRIAQVSIAEKTLDKFEDYMKNVDKLNTMINEFKGCVSIARGAIAKRKELDKEFEEMKKVTKISQQIYDAMLSFIKASENLEVKKYFKIDAIYSAICEKKEEKPKKKGKPRKKNPNPSP